MPTFSAIFEIIIFEYTCHMIRCVPCMWYSKQWNQIKIASGADELNPISISSYPCLSTGTVCAEISKHYALADPSSNVPATLYDLRYQPTRQMWIMGEYPGPRSLQLIDQRWLRGTSDSWTSGLELETLSYWFCWIHNWVRSWYESRN